MDVFKFAMLNFLKLQHEQQKKKKLNGPIPARYRKRTS